MLFWICIYKASWKYWLETIYDINMYCLDKLSIAVDQYFDVKPEC
jgi:hypothetical protein